MYALASPGVKVTVRQASGLAADYIVVAPHPHPGGFLLKMAAVDITGRDLAGSEAEYTLLDFGEEITVVFPQGFERQARIGQTTVADIVLVPLSMQSGEDGCDCPHCWRQDIEGSPTGTGTGVGFGSAPINVVPTIKYSCPDCSNTWTSLEWNKLVHELL